jgi:hypothetical protein
MGLILLWTTILAMALGAVVWLCCRIKVRAISSEPQCRRCGYLVMGNVSGVCPECGNDLRGGGIHVPKPRGPLGFKTRVVAWSVAVVAACNALPAAVREAIDERQPYVCNDEFSYTFTDWSRPGPALVVLVQFDHREANRPARMIGLFRPDQTTVTALNLDTDAALPGPGVLINPVGRAYRLAPSSTVHNVGNLAAPAAPDPQWDDARSRAWMAERGISDVQGFGAAAGSLIDAASKSRDDFRAQLEVLETHRFDHAGVACHGFSHSLSYFRPRSGRSLVNQIGFGMWLLGCVVIAVACLRHNRKVERARWAAIKSRWQWAAEHAAGE